MKLKNWSELFPNGRHIFYEGDDPKGFIKEIQTRFGFDPSKSNDSWNKSSGYCFYCPPEHLDKIYTQYQMGS